MRAIGMDPSLAPQPNRHAIPKQTKQYWCVSNLEMERKHGDTHHLLCSAMTFSQIYNIYVFTFHLSDRVEKGTRGEKVLHTACQI